MKKSGGFTLIEILVVVAIIGILATIGITSYSGLTQKSKDVKKKADIDALANAYELNYDAKDKLYQPLTEVDIAGTFSQSSSYTGCLSTTSPTFRICTALEGHPEPTCNIPSKTCYCKESIYGDLSEVSSQTCGDLVAQLPSPSSTPDFTPSPSPTPTTVPIAKRVFITSTAYNGANLGGLAGADQKCLDQANAANLCGGTPCASGSWKAWLSSSSVSASSRLSPHPGPYQLVDGVTQVADNWTDLTDGTLDRLINKTETGQLIGTNYPWTNSSYNGSIYRTTGTCSDWTSTSGSGIAGNNSSASSGAWTVSASLSCSEPHQLYCFEQDDPLPTPSPTPTPTPTPTPPAACADGTNDQAYSTSMVGCNGTVAFNNAGSLCAGGSSVCQLSQYTRRGGTTTQPTAARWLRDQARSAPLDCPSTLCGGAQCVVYRSGNNVGLLASPDSLRGFANTCNALGPEDVGWIGTDSLNSPHGTMCCN